VKLSIPDMSCGHCKAAVERAIATVDPAAKVSVDLGTHTAEVESSAPIAAILGALSEENYPASVTG